MNFIKKILCSALALMTLVLPVLPVAAAATAQEARTYPLVLSVDGLRVSMLNEQQKQVPALFSNGSYYLPVRTAGEWLGKTVTWEGVSQTIALSGANTPVFHDDNNATDFAFAYEYGKAVNVTARNDITILMDGEKQAFFNAAGQRVYPILYQGTTYLPLRNVAALLGKEIAWRNATADQAPQISVYTPMSKTEQTACAAYLEQMAALAEQVTGAAAGLYPSKSDKAALSALLAQMGDSLDEGQEVAVPDVPYLKFSSKTVTRAIADELALLADAKSKLSTQTADELFATAHGQASGILMQVMTANRFSNAVSDLAKDYERVGLEQ